MAEIELRKLLEMLNIPDKVEHELAVNDRPCWWTWERMLEKTKELWRNKNEND